MKHIAFFSGGKDSTAMLLLILENNLPLDEIIFNDTTVEFPDMYDHIDKVKKSKIDSIVKQIKDNIVELEKLGLTKEEVLKRI